MFNVYPETLATHKLSDGTPYYNNKRVARAYLEGIIIRLTAQLLLQPYTRRERGNLFFKITLLRQHHCRGPPGNS